MQVLLTLKFADKTLGVIHHDCFMSDFTVIIQTEENSVIDDTLTWVDEMKLGYRVGHFIKTHQVPSTTMYDFSLSEANVAIRDSIEMVGGAIEQRISEAQGDTVSILDVKHTLGFVDSPLYISMVVLK